MLSWFNINSERSFFKGIVSNLFTTVEISKGLDFWKTLHDPKNRMNPKLNNKKDILTMEMKLKFELGIIFAKHDREMNYSEIYLT